MDWQRKETEDGGQGFLVAFSRGGWLPGEAGTFAWPALVIHRESVPSGGPGRIGPLRFVWRQRIEQIKASVMPTA